MSKSPITDQQLNTNPMKLAAHPKNSKSHFQTTHTQSSPIINHHLSIVDRDKTVTLERGGPTIGMWQSTRMGRPGVPEPSDKNVLSHFGIGSSVCKASLGDYFF